MLTLKTGLPRNGKTISVVAELQALLARWEKRPDERRPVYQFGIPELKLEGVQEVEAWPLGGKRGDAIPRTADGKPTVALTFDQDQIPDGSLVVVDECQDFYPPRGPSQQAPSHVRALNTHGHRNLDYILLTQHPKLIDNAVRRLVNKHQHYRRAMGGQKAITYEWDFCSDSLEFGKAIKGLFTYPRKAFGLYRSASGFTRPKFKWPLFLVIPLVALPIGVWAVPKAISVLHSSMTGRGVGAQPSSASASAPVQSGARALPLAPVQSAASASEAFWRRISGCFAVGDNCRCMDNRGMRVEVPVDICLKSASGYDGVVAWAPRSPVPSVKVDASAAPVPSSGSRLGPSEPPSLSAGLRW